MDFGRIYSIWDKKRRMFVYVGQTVRADDFNPHGRQMRRIWDNPKHRCRYVYCVEREWERIAAEHLNKCESKFIFRRNTFNDFNPRGMNFTAGGGCYGRPSAETNAKNSALVKAAMVADPERRLRHAERLKKSWADPAWRASTVAKMKKKLEDTEFAEKRRQALISALNTSEVKRRNSAAKTAAFSTVSHREAKRLEGLREDRRENMKRARRICASNPQHESKRRAGIAASHITPEVRKKISDGLKTVMAARRLLCKTP